MSSALRPKVALTMFPGVSDPALRELIPEFYLVNSGNAFRLGLNKLEAGGSGCAYITQ